MNPTTILHEIDAYCAATGLARKTVCHRAFGNPRMYQRLKSQAERLDKAALVFRTFQLQRPANDPASHNRLKKHLNKNTESVSKAY